MPYGLMDKDDGPTIGELVVELLQLHRGSADSDKSELCTVAKEAELVATIVELVGQQFESVQIEQMPAQAPETCHRTVAQTVGCFVAIAILPLCLLIGVLQAGTLEWPAYGISGVVTLTGLKRLCPSRTSVADWVRAIHSIKSKGNESSES